MRINYKKIIDATPIYRTDKFCCYTGRTYWYYIWLPIVFVFDLYVSFTYWWNWITRCKDKECPSAYRPTSLEYMHFHTHLKLPVENHTSRYKLLDLLNSKSRNIYHVKAWDSDGFRMWLGNWYIKYVKIT